MATRQLENVRELLKMARKRASFPRNWLQVKYYRDVDVLVIRFTETPVTHSKGDLENGLVFNYDSQDNLVNLEILDLYDIYATV